MRRYPAGLYGKKVLYFDGVDDYVYGTSVGKIYGARCVWI